MTDLKDRAKVQPAKQIKPIDESKLRDTKQVLRFVVIGHVDAGKSTLMGRLLFDIGALDKKQARYNEQESKRVGKGSFNWAWAMDSTEEERRRGVTIDIAAKHFETKNRNYVILDAPGHKDFIPNMISGACQADSAILVIDASPGGFESGFLKDGQTIEHAMLVRSLGIQHIIVAINKLESVKWSEERFVEIKTQLEPALVSFGYDKKRIFYVPCSGLQGLNVIESNVTELKSWWNGHTILSALEEIPSAKHDSSLPLLFIADGLSKTENSNLWSIDGRIDSGSMQVGMKLKALPCGQQLTIKRLNINYNPVSFALAGSNVCLDVSLADDEEEIRPGDVICDQNSPIHLSTKFKARIITFDISRPILAGTTCSFHRDRINERAVIEGLVAAISKADASIIKNRPRQLPKNASGLVEIAIAGPAIPIEPYEQNRFLGKFVLRNEGSTIAIGIVTELL